MTCRFCLGCCCCPRTRRPQRLRQALAPTKIADGRCARAVVSGRWRGRPERAVPLATLKGSLLLPALICRRTHWCDSVARSRLCLCVSVLVCVCVRTWQLLRGHVGAHRTCHRAVSVASVSLQPQAVRVLSDAGQSYVARWVDRSSCPTCRGRYRSSGLARASAPATTWSLGGQMPLRSTAWSQAPRGPTIS